MSWIDIKNRLPEDQKKVLVKNDNSEYVCVFFNKKVLDTPYYFCSQEVIGLIIANVTHWMYIPE